MQVQRDISRGTNEACEARRHIKEVGAEVVAEQDLNYQHVFPASTMSHKYIWSANEPVIISLSDRCNMTVCYSKRHRDIEEALTRPSAH